MPGLLELREAVAALYNRLYRKGLPSQYTAENVSISGGGRAALTRAAASLGHINLGHFLPDYTAYEELLDVFKAFTAIPILLEGERGYAFTSEDLRKEIQGRGLSALLLSNPCNPTGKLVQGEELSRWVRIGRELECSLLVDEFYSHYVWTARPGQLPIESAARYVEDQELALSGLARDLDGGTGEGDRRGGQRRLLPRRWGVPPPAAGGGSPLDRGGRAAGDARDQRGVP